MSLQFRTGRRSSLSAPSARFVALAIEERRDREAVKRRRRVPRGSALSPATVEARLWARRVGFSDELVPKAAVCALYLRRKYGVGNVTVEQVRRLLGGAG